MKYLQQLGFVMVAFLFLNSFTTSQERIVGKWKGEDKGETGFLTLTEDGFATFQLNDQVLGGKSFEMRGMTVQMTYEVDRSQYPIAMDFVISTTSGDEEIGRMLGIIEMLGKDELHLAMNFEGNERPKDFDGDNIVFNRM